VPVLELKDLDGGEYTVLMTVLTEEAIEPYAAAHPDGGMIATMEFALVP
jgi:hypothetical protein